jgi:Fic family protein
MYDLQQQIAAKRAELDRLRTQAPHSLGNLEHVHDLELTYTSNAIEGNTLTLRETAEVIEHGITVGGKQLKEHLEAVDHYEAVLWIRELAAQTTPVGETVVRELHRRIVARSEREIAGVYSPHRRRIAGSPVVFPNPLKTPELMQEFGTWLEQAPLTPEAAFDAHFRLTAIHPFSDGNGRTARLLMNLMLIRGGYPPVAVRPEDRPAYVGALQQAQAGKGTEAFDLLLYRRLDATLGEYLSASKEALPQPTQPRHAIKPGSKPER